MYLAQSNVSGRSPPLKPRPIMYLAQSSLQGISSRISETAMSLRAVTATL